MSVTFESARPDDAAALLAAQIAAFHHDSTLYPDIELGGPPGYDSLEALQQKIVEDICYTIFADEQIVGGIVIFTKDIGHYHLDLIFIHPDYHNRGIGTQAMTFIEDTHPATHWTLDTPQWAIRNIHFYEKLGYIKIGEFEDDGTPLIAYEKQIKPPQT